MNELQLIYDIATNLSDVLLFIGFLTYLGLLYFHRGTCEEDSDVHRHAIEALATTDDLSALRAHDAAIWREAAEYCKQQADEWDSDRVLTFKTMPAIAPTN